MWSIWPTVRATASNCAKYKKWLILHILLKKNTHFSICKILHIYKSVTITFAFNILVFFFSLYLWCLSVSPHSLFISFDQIKMPKPLTLSALSFSHLIIFLYLPPIAITTNLSPPFNISTTIDCWSQITPISRWSLSNRFPLFLVVWSVDFGLNGVDLAFLWVEWGFGYLGWSGRIEWVFGYLAFLDDSRWVDNGGWLLDDGGWSHWRWLGGLMVGVDWLLGSVGCVRERGSEEIIKNCKIMNILLNKCIE